MAEVVEQVIACWGSGSWIAISNDGGAETAVLRVSIDKAKVALGWRPLWTVTQAVDRTVAWHRDQPRAASAAEVRALCHKDLHAYHEAARAAGLRWSRA